MVVQQRAEHEGARHHAEEKHDIEQRDDPRPRLGRGKVIGERQARCLRGVNARTHQRSSIAVSSIVATRGPRHAVDKLRAGYLPPLNNRALFRRDDHFCLYCGDRFPARRLSRDHVRPLSKGGRDHWSNVVTACLRCNGHKAGRTPEQAGMELLAIPFVPTHPEYIFLQGRNVLADQMEFLRAHFPRTSPLHGRQPRN